MFRNFTMLKFSPASNIPELHKTESYVDCIALKIFIITWYKSPASLKVEDAIMSNH